MLELIVSAAGRFVKMDESTSLITKGRFARVAVEVDTARPLAPGTEVVLDGVDAPIFWQRFVYEHVHSFCPRGGYLGHNPADCQSSSPSPATLSVPTNPNPSSLLPEDVMASDDSHQPVDDDHLAPSVWIHVRWRGRHPRQPLNSTGPTRDVSRAHLTQSPKLPNGLRHVRVHRLC